MSLLDQIRTLDRLLHDASSRRAFLADREAWLDGISPEDRPPFAQLDGARLEVVAGDLRNKVHSRWYADRFPLSLRAAAQLSGRSAPELVEVVMAHAAFARCTDEDGDGNAFFSACLDVASDVGARAPWLRDLLAYEYLTRCGLPRRAAGEPVASDLEQRLLRDPVELAPQEGTGLRLATRALATTFHFPAGAIAEHLATGGVLPDEVEREEERTLFALRDEHADEIADAYPLHEILFLLAERARSPEELTAEFGEGAEELVAEALRWLSGEGVVVLSS